MKHAIARLTRDLETLAHNESIARGEGRTTDADNIAAEASDVREAVSVLQVYQRFGDREPRIRPFANEDYRASGSFGGVEWEVAARLTTVDTNGEVTEYDMAAERLHCELMLLAERFKPQGDDPSLFDRVKGSMSPEEDDGYLTFEQFVQHGIDQGVTLTRGMPWSFNFHGFPVTHETDDRYLVGSEIQFCRGERIRVLDGTVMVLRNPAAP